MSLKSVAVLCCLIVGVSCWGDLLHYPEYVRFVSQLRPESESEKVGNYARDSRSLVSSVLPLRYLKTGIWGFNSPRGFANKLIKRSFSSSQLRRKSRHIRNALRGIPIPQMVLREGAEMEQS